METIKSASQGTKFDTDKPRLELISTIATFQKARVMGEGAQKYGVDNWRKGIAWSRIIGACLRHIFAWMNGEDKDPETGYSHLAHAACCIDFLLEYEFTHRELDDRHKPVQVGTPTSYPDPQPGKTYHICPGCHGLKGSCTCQ